MLASSLSPTGSAKPQRFWPPVVPPGGLAPELPVVVREPASVDPGAGVRLPGAGAPGPVVLDPAPGRAEDCGGWTAVPGMVLGVLPGVPVPGEPGVLPDRPPLPPSPPCARTMPARPAERLPAQSS
jgi:hypothetical protein